MAGCRRHRHLGVARPLSAAHAWRGRLYYTLNKADAWHPTPHLHITTSGEHPHEQTHLGHLAHRKRTPYDSPLRDGNRDRLIGLLTERATKT